MKRPTIFSIIFGLLLVSSCRDGPFVPTPDCTPWTKFYIVNGQDTIWECTDPDRHPRP